MLNNSTQVTTKMRFLTYASVVILGLFGLSLSVPTSQEARGAFAEEDYEPPVPGGDL